jgi:hypothetical protein
MTPNMAFKTARCAGWDLRVAARPEGLSSTLGDSVGENVIDDDD